MPKPPAERGPALADWLGPAGLVTGLVAWLLATWVLPQIVAPWLAAGVALPNLTRLYLDHSHWLLGLVAASILVNLLEKKFGGVRTPGLWLARGAVAAGGMLSLAMLIIAAALPVMSAAALVG